MPPSCGQGMVCVKVRCDSSEARSVIIEVLDTGCGIPQKDMARLLVPFSQVGDVSVYTSLDHIIHMH